MNEMIYLISESYEADDIGNDVSEKTELSVWADVSSVSQSEFNVAAQNGLQAEYKFKMWFDEYGGEKLVKYNGKRYKVYRTYKDKDYIELYVEGDVSNE